MPFFFFFYLFFLLLSPVFSAHPFQHFFSSLPSSTSLLLLFNITQCPPIPTQRSLPPLLPSPLYLSLPLLFFSPSSHLQPASSSSSSSESAQHPLSRSTSLQRSLTLSFHPLSFLHLARPIGSFAGSLLSPSNCQGLGGARD